MKFPEKLAQKLQKRQEMDAFRKLYVNSTLIDFCSNDYLGLSQNTQLRQNIEAELLQNAYQIGATGSRLISGNSHYVQNLEKYLSDVFESPAALIFNSGYQANTALLSALPQKGELILADQHIHASLKEGIRLSFAEKFYFKHNNLDDLEKKLQKSHVPTYVLIESVYSMDGDEADLEKTAQICEKYGAYLIVDEAHSTGIWGRNGNGLCCEKGISDKIFARLYTFGKAIGSHGACVAGSQMLVDYLINFANPFIYTTALPYHSLLSIQKSFEFIAQNPDLKGILFQKIAFFQEIASKKEIFLPKNNTPIQIVKIGGNTKTKKIAQELQKIGFDVRPILSPTVAEGNELLRICLHTFNTENQVEELLEQIRLLLKY